MDRAELEKKIIAKAWKDPEFKKELLAKPNETIQRFVKEVYNNQDVLPKDLRFKVIEDTDNMLTIVVPPTPENNGELSDAEMEIVVGGRNLPSKSAGKPRIIYHHGNRLQTGNTMSEEQIGSVG